MLEHWIAHCQMGCDGPCDFTAPLGMPGARPTGLVARITCRPAASSSSLIWQPDWALPTTSTPPSDRWSGISVVGGVILRDPIRKRRG